MNAEEIKKKSKWLSKHLRHSPERIGLELGAGGWVDVEELLKAAQKFHMRLSREQLEEVVSQNDKQRFGWNEDKTKIRASQGHSEEVDLGLEPQTPPPILYHGTATHNRDLLLREGLKKMRRQHVHLSSEIATATKVGARHGKPLIFLVDAARMHADGCSFFVSDNGVWLVEEVLPRYLKENPLAEN